MKSKVMPVNKWKIEQIEGREILLRAWQPTLQLIAWEKSRKHT
jgi:hypothetical protein